MKASKIITLGLVAASAGLIMGTVALPAQAASPPSGNTAICKDSPSGAQIDAGELRQVDLQHQGDQLKATFKLAHSIPQTGTFGTFLGVSNTDGTKARQLGVEWLDGKLMSCYVLDIGGAPLQNLKGQPVVDNKTVIATFPWDAVSDLGAVWNWDAATSVEGDDADYCPEPGADWRNPKMAQFPSN